MSATTAPTSCWRTTVVPDAQLPLRTRRLGLRHRLVRQEPVPHTNAEGHDRTNGRIFKISYQAGRMGEGRSDEATIDELVELQLNQNDWYVRHARRILQERAAAGEFDPKVRERLNQWPSRPCITQQLRAMWALHVSGGLPNELVYRRLLGDKMNMSVRGRCSFAGS